MRSAERMRSDLRGRRPRGRAARPRKTERRRRHGVAGEVARRRERRDRVEPLRQLRRDALQVPPQGPDERGAGVVVEWPLRRLAVGAPARHAVSARRQRGDVVGRQGRGDLARARRDDAPRQGRPPVHRSVREGRPALPDLRQGRVEARVGHARPLRVPVVVPTVVPLVARLGERVGGRLSLGLAPRGRPRGRDLVARQGHLAGRVGRRDDDAPRRHAGDVHGLGRGAGKLAGRSAQQAQ